MRSILAALALTVLPGAALAECACVCNGGQAVGVCNFAYETPPICQQLCTAPIKQSIDTPPLTTAIGPSGVYATPALVPGNPAAPAGVAGHGAGAPVANANSVTPGSETSAYGVVPNATGSGSLSALPPGLAPPRLGATGQSYNPSTAKPWGVR